MYAQMRWLLMMCCLFAGMLQADEVTVYNKTDQIIYVAVYKQKNVFRASEAKQAGSAVAINPGENKGLNRPGKELGYDRELAFSFNQSDLPGTLGVQEFNSRHHINIGDTRGSNFYIAEEKGKIKGFNQIEWDLVQPALRGLKRVKNEAVNAIAAPIKDLIREQLPELKDYPHKGEQAFVRVGNQLHAGEREYLRVRQPKVKGALEKLLGRSIDAVPVIALVESGGGYRAMTCSLGWHVGAAKMGLMDAVTYMVGLSGSTWSIGLWVLSGLSIEQFKEQLLSLMGGIDKISPNEFKLMANSWLVKTAFDQELTLVDLYAGLLANALLKPFGDKRQRVYLSDQVNAIKDGQSPLPIYTAVRAEDKVPQDYWYEFTPYEIGASWLGAYVPTWAYGRKFDGGKSIDFAPEQSFGFQMGTFGSAFAARIEQIYAELIKNDPLSPPFDTIVNALIDRIGQERVTRARVFNFAAGMPAAKAVAYPLQAQMQMVDAGVAFNLPYPPISGERPERKADIMIFLDASGGTIGDDLKKVEAYARGKGLKFPPIDYTNIGKNAVSVFKDETDPSVPLVIYLPRVMDIELFNAMDKNPEYSDLSSLLKGFDVEQCLKGDYCDTSNFKYMADQVRQLSGMTEFNIRARGNTIRQAIDWKINQMAGKSMVEKKPEEPQPQSPGTAISTPAQEQGSSESKIGSAAGDGYFWNNPPRYQVKCDNGAQLKDDEGKPCTFMSKHCGCVCEAGKRLNPLSVEKQVSGVVRAHWGCK